MGDDIAIFEAVIRGAASGISLVLAIILALTGPQTAARRLCALFSFSVAVYVLVAGEHTQRLLAGLMPLAVLISIWGTVFFWWFAAALFEDTFRWRWWRVAPFLVLPSLYFVRQALPEGGVSSTLLTLHLTGNALLFADTLRLALVNASDDLVSPRRRFRFSVAAVVAIFGISIAIAELTERHHVLPDMLRLLHAGAIFILNVAFSIWLLAPRTVLFVDEPQSAHRPEAPDKQAIAPADRAAYEKLQSLMLAGAYREDGLTVSRLAAQVGIPEHALRKLINGSLGYRNFSAFLNAARIEEAKTALANPENARRQILQIALDLGYGSIAPFNRAFKAATGMTPSEFRTAALESR